MGNLWVAAVIKKTYACLFLFCTLINPLFGQSEELSITAQSDRDQITLNDRLRYEVVISGTGSTSIPNVDLPDFRGQFDVVSSSESTSISIVNGQMSASKIRNYVLVPVKTGEFVIEPAQIRYKGHIYKTNSLKITVTAASASSPQSNQQLPSPSRAQNKGMIKGNIFLHAALNKQHIYVGEQVTYSLLLFRRIQLWSNVEYEVPKFQGFWVDDLKRKEEPYVQEVEGVPFYVFELAKKALFPLQSGKITLNPAKSVFIANPFEGQRTETSSALTLDVRPLPEDGKPKGFSGLVGDVTLKAHADKTSVDTNTPFTVKIELSGRGYLKSVNELVYSESPDMKVYKSKVEDHLERVDQVKGKRIFEYIVVPKVSGPLKTPEFQLSFFSPTEKRYKTIIAPPISFTSITPPTTSGYESASFSQLATKENIEILRTEIRYLKPIGKKENEKYLFRHPFFILIGLLNLLCFIYWIGDSVRKRFFVKDEKSFKRQKAADMALKRLKEVGKRLQQHPGEISKTQNVFLEFLSNKTGQPFLAMTTDQMRTHLTQSELSKEHVDAITALLEKLSFAGYAPSAMNARDIQHLHQNTTSLIRELKGAL